MKSPCGNCHNLLLPRKHLERERLLCEVTGFIRGATNSKQVLENFSTFMMGGNKTHLYPIELAAELLGAQPEMPLEHWNIGVSVGNAVVMACHLLVWATIRYDLLEKCPVPDKKKFAVHLRQALILSTIWKPMADMKQAIFDSISTKQAAARRAKTSVLGFVAAYNIVVEKEVAKRAQRKSRSELLLEMLRWHNRQEESRAGRLQQVEMKAIQTLSSWSTGAECMRTLLAIWGASPPAQSSVTTDMLAADYLDAGKTASFPRRRTRCGTRSFSRRRRSRTTTCAVAKALSSARSQSTSKQAASPTSTAGQTNSGTRRKSWATRWLR